LSNLTTITYDMRNRLEAKFSGSWGDVQYLRVWDFGLTGSQSGLRFGDARDSGPDPRSGLERIDGTVGRMFPITDNDFFRARAIGHELRECIRAELVHYGRCIPGISVIDKLSGSVLIVPVAQVSSGLKPTDRERETETMADPVSPPMVPQVSASHYVVVVVNFEMEYASC
jgi:hypothetical protein